MTIRLDRVPTFQRSPTFERDLKALTKTQRETFKSVVLTAFVPDLASRQFRPSLRVKRVQGTRGVWEMTWDHDGRATFEYGREQHPGEPHIIWRRVGTHDIFRDA